MRGPGPAGGRRKRPCGQLRTLTRSRSIRTGGLARCLAGSHVSYTAGRVLARLSRHRAVVPRVEARAYESADPIPPTSLPQTSPPPDSRHRILSTQPPGEDAWNCLPSLARPRGRRQHSRGPRQRGPAAPFRGTAHGGTFASRRRVVGVLDSEMEMLTDAVEGAGGPGRRSGPSTPVRTVNLCRPGSGLVLRAAGSLGRPGLKPTLFAPQAAGDPQPVPQLRSRPLPAGSRRPSGPGAR